MRKVKILGRAWERQVCVGRSLGVTKVWRHDDLVTYRVIHQFNRGTSLLPRHRRGSPWEGLEMRAPSEKNQKFSFGPTSILRGWGISTGLLTDRESRRNQNARNFTAARRLRSPEGCCRTEALYLSVDHGRSTEA